MRVTVNKALADPVISKFRKLTAIRTADITRVIGKSKARDAKFQNFQPGGKLPKATAAGRTRDGSQRGWG